MPPDVRHPARLRVDPRESPDRREVAQHELGVVLEAQPAERGPLAEPLERPSAIGDARLEEIPHRADGVHPLPVPAQRLLTQEGEAPDPRQPEERDAHERRAAPREEPRRAGFRTPDHRAHARSERREGDGRMGREQERRIARAQEDALQERGCAERVHRERCAARDDADAGPAFGMSRGFPRSVEGNEARQDESQRGDRRRRALQRPRVDAERRAQRRIDQRRDAQRRNRCAAPRRNAQAFARPGEKTCGAHGEADRALRRYRRVGGSRADQDSRNACPARERRPRHREDDRRARRHHAARVALIQSRGGCGHRGLVANRAGAWTALDPISARESAALERRAAQNTPVKNSWDPLHRRGAWPVGMPRALALEGARRLQHEVVAVARADDLQADRQAARARGRRAPSRRGATTG